MIASSKQILLGFERILLNLPPTGLGSLARGGRLVELCWYCNCWESAKHYNTTTSGIIKWKTNVSIAGIHWTQIEECLLGTFMTGGSLMPRPMQPSHEEATQISSLPLASENTPQISGLSFTRQKVSLNASDDVFTSTALNFYVKVCIQHTLPDSYNFLRHMQWPHCRCM